jgi:L-asparaginase II
MTGQIDLRVSVTRGGRIESEHRAVVAVVDRNGDVIASAGDSDFFAYLRSSAKPFQAIPLVASGAADAYGFTESELAFCCSSHHAEATQQQAVVTMLEKIDASPELLQCGAAPPLDESEFARVTLGIVPKSPLQNCCSGKHTGMLATCLHLGYPVESYLSPEHTLQVQILEVVSEAMQREPASIALAADGCSVPTFGATVTDFARAFAALASPSTAPSALIRSHEATIARLLAAMTAYPENIAGKGSLDTELMRLSNRKIAAKLGAEGLLCMALPDQEVGIAIRMCDGTYRGLNILAIEVLEQLGLVDATELADMQSALNQPVTNANGWVVGEFSTDLALR